MFMKEPHTTLFIAPTGVGKTHLASSLLETEHRNHFDFIVIICPTLRYNSTYKNRSWVWNDPDVIPIEPGNNLYYLSEKISNLLAGDKTLFLIDEIIADETLDKHHQPLLELAISGRHRGHCLWLLTQSYTAVFNPITYGGLFGPDHQIIDHNSKTALSSTSKLGDFLFLSIRHTLAEF